MFPRSEKAKYGYFTLSHFSPAKGTGGNIQGGMNEAGLTFDFNAIPEVKDFTAKKSFLAGDAAILLHVLATMESVEQAMY